MDENKCPDCEQPLEDKDQGCLACSKAEDNQDRREDKESERPGEEAKPGKLKMKPSLLIAGGGILLLLLVGGAFFLLRPGEQQNADGQTPAASDNADEEEQDTDTALKNDEPEDEQPEATTLDSILEADYTNCKDTELRAGEFTGFLKLQICVREIQQKTLIVLQIYQSLDPETATELEKFERWCGEETDKNLSAIRGDDFAILYSSFVNLEIEGEQERQGTSLPEYIRTGNKILETEYEFLKEQGLKAELVNTCVDF